MNSNERSSLANYLGGISSAIRSKKRDPNYTINAANFADEIRALDKSPKVLDGTLDVYDNNSTIEKVNKGIFEKSEHLESLSLGAVTGHIEEKAFFGIKTLEEVNITSCGGVDAYAFQECKNVTTLNLGVINGPIGKKAFLGLEAVEEFSIDPSSNITELGDACFAGLGYNRHNNQRFYMDLRNSTFKIFSGFDQSGNSSGTGGSPYSSDSGAVVSLAVSNMEIRLPSTVEYIGKRVIFNDDILISEGDIYDKNPKPYKLVYLVDGAAVASESGFVLNGADNIDLYISSPDIMIEDPAVFPSDENSHIFVSYEYYGSYKDAFNWCAIGNLYGFKTYANNATLPTMTLEGHPIQWYSDSNLTATISKGNGQEIYCKITGNRAKVRIISRGMEGGHVTITDSNSNSYSINNLVNIGTTLTITPVCDLSPTVERKYFSINGVPYSDASAQVKVPNGSTEFTIMLSYNTYPASYYWGSGSKSNSQNTFSYVAKDKIVVKRMGLDKFSGSNFPSNIITNEEVNAAVTGLAGMTSSYSSSQQQYSLFGTELNKDIVFPSTMTSFYYPTNNNYYSSYQPYLVTSKGNSFYYSDSRNDSAWYTMGPSNHSITISSNTKGSLGSCAFTLLGASNINLGGIEQIASYALTAAYYGDSAELPGSLKKIDGRLSTYTPELETAIQEFFANTSSSYRSINIDSYAKDIYYLYYNGTMEDWCNLDKYTVCCLYQAAEDEGKQPQFYIYDANGSVTYNGKRYKPLTEMIIPNTITTIKQRQFTSTGIMTFTIPNSIERFADDYAFVTRNYMTEGTVASTSHNPNSWNSIKDAIKPNYGGSTSGKGVNRRLTIYYDGTLVDWFNIETPSYETFDPIALCSAFYVLDPNGNTTHNGKRYTNILAGPTLTIPEGVKRIRNGTFAYLNTITSVSMPSVQEIGTAAFKGCTALTTVSMGAVKYIGISAFENCTALTTCNFPVTLATIKEDAFSNTILSSISLTGGLKVIEKNALACKNNSISSLTIRSLYLTNLCGWLNYNNVYSSIFPSTSHSLTPANIDILVPNATTIDQNFISGVVYPVQIPEGCRTFIISPNIDANQTLTIPISLDMLTYSGSTKSSITLNYAGPIELFNSNLKTNVKSGAKSLLGTGGVVHCTNGNVTLT